MFRRIVPVFLTCITLKRFQMFNIFLSFSPIEMNGRFLQVSSHTANFDTRVLSLRWIMSFKKRHSYEQRNNLHAGKMCCVRFCCSLMYRHHGNHIGVYNDRSKCSGTQTHTGVCIRLVNQPIKPKPTVLIPLFTKLFSQLLNPVFPPHQRCFATVALVSRHPTHQRQNLATLTILPLWTSLNFSIHLKTRLFYLAYQLTLSIFYSSSHKL